MCGINGFVALDDTSDQVIEDSLNLMNLTIDHRGGDHRGTWVSGHVGLGHCRLSIQDVTAAGDQPFVKNGFSLVFNGEIYNFKQLRALLPKVTWQSGSDTEVLLELWASFGTECLPLLRGMFAFAIFDHETNELYLCRDPYGIKPLYFSQQSDSFIFSSELKAIRAVGVKTTPNVGVLAESALLCWVRDSQCVVNEVQKLQPGHYARLTNKVIEFTCYSNTKRLLSLKIDKSKSEQDYVDGLNDVLVNSVDAHLVSDVPVSAFLSGGLDSSLLVAMAAKKAADMSCYTIKFGEDDKKFERMADDAYYANQVANKFGVKLHTIEVKPDLANLLQKVVYHLDEPIGDSAAINTYLICEAAKLAGVKVILSGMGADEIFGGYRKHLANIYAGQFQKIPGVVRKGINTAVDMFPSANSTQGFKAIRWAKKFLSFANLKPEDAFLRSYSYYDLHELTEAFEFDVKTHLDSLVADHHHCFVAAFKARGLLDAMCYTDVTNFMVGLNLHYTDRASMACATEVRVPFVDKEVIEYGFSIPQELKIKGGQQKYILKKVAEQWLPHDVIYRPKSPFTLPLRSWIKNDLDNMVSEYLLAADGLAGRNILKRSFIEKLVADEKSGSQDNAQKIWHLLTLEQWLRNNDNVQI